ncbi:helix-turn-helix domain-containing protein [Dysgonomonas sp. 521]|uniref:helix-turn-helix domain-containing protein n=1 Tax=Dysgonomonas sp. 521 TaxID=2302932 RepID=UPI0013D56A81|nr:helix-turn-helix domain-containing protein [Dysgonomonas sp. 521]
MNTSVLHDNIINAIKEKVPSNTNITAVLMDILYIGKEAIYRRLRGDVPFTFEELASISKVLGISLDNIAGSTMQKSKPFQLKLTDYVNPTEADYGQMEDFIDILRSARKDDCTEFASSANIFQQTLYIGHEYLNKFYLFKSLYQTNGLDSVKSLDDIKMSKRLNDIQKRYQEETMYIKHTFYIWDYMIFRYLVNDIKYFASIRYITSEDVAALKEDLLTFMDRMEKLATKGEFETGNKVQLYLSSLNFESTYSYMQTQNLKLSHIIAFTLNAVVSLDTTTFDRVQQWIDALKRLSTLISESGEMQRVKFFKEQRELVNTL